jgi:hypothetical protein
MMNTEKGEAVEGEDIGEHLVHGQIYVICTGVDYANANR